MEESESLDGERSTEKRPSTLRDETEYAKRHRGGCLDAVLPKRSVRQYAKASGMVPPHMRTLSIRTGLFGQVPTEEVGRVVRDYDVAVDARGDVARRLVQRLVVDPAALERRIVLRQAVLVVRDAQLLLLGHELVAELLGVPGKQTKLKSLHDARRTRRRCKILGLLSTSRLNFSGYQRSR